MQGTSEPTKLKDKANMVMAHLKDIKDVLCYRYGEKGHYSHSCPVKREDDVASTVVTTHTGTY